MSAMRIVVATDQWFPDRTGGSSRVAAETARRLAGRGHTVTVIAPHADGQAREEHSGDLRIVRALPRTAFPQTLLDVTAARAGAGRTGPADVLLAHQPTVALGAAAALRGVPLVTVFHASPALEARYVAEHRALTKEGIGARALAPVLAHFEAAALRRSARVLVLSEYSRSLAIDGRPWLRPRLGLVSGGVDTEWFSPDGPGAARGRFELDPGEPILFTARRLEPRMGLDVLLDALREVPAARLALAGSGSLEKELRRRAGALGVADRVLFLGRIPEEELRDWYRAADAVVMPTGAYEGFGLTTVEALACGTPVVGTPVGATPELLLPLDRGLVAAGSDARALAAALSSTLERTDPELRRRCREYACARFSWDDVITSWETELLNAAKPHVQTQIDLFGLRLDALTVPDVVERIENALATGGQVTHASVNAAKAVRVQNDADLRAAVRDSDLVTADGQPVVWAARLAGGRLPERVAGIDLMEAVLRLADRRAYRVYLLGALPEVLPSAAAEIRRRYPGAQLVGTQDGYFRAADEPAIVQRIAAARPDILFIALGTPEKEMFQLRNRDALGAGFVMGVGGAFDILAGRTRRAPKWAQRGGLEWAFRLAQEPRRLLRRYVVGNARFVALTVREVARARTSRASSEVSS